MIESELNLLSSRIIGACIEVHKHLGPGLLESIYLDCLTRELTLRDTSWQRECQIPVIYKGETFTTKLRADLIVEKAVIVELKSTAEMLPIYEAQLISYLKLSEIELGLLINFNVTLLKDGIKRMRLNHGEVANKKLENILRPSRRQ